MNRWHVPAEALDAYVLDRAGEVTAASVEAHLLACAVCRSALADRTGAGAPGLTTVLSARPVLDVARLDRLWDGVLDRVDAPRPGLLERLLVRLGVAEGDARLLAVTPSLRTAWLAAVATALLVALVLASGTWGQQAGAARLGDLVFLTLVPLLPLAGVSAAYGAHTDPAHEVGVAAPYPGLRLLLLRTAAVLATSLPLAAVASPLLGLPPLLAAAWLLPALGVTAAALALSTLLDVLPATVLAGTAWLAGVAASAAASGGDRLAAFGPAGQAVSLLALLGGVAVLLLRRDRLATLERSL